MKGKALSPAFSQMTLEAATGFEPVNNDALHRCPSHWAIAAFISMSLSFPELPPKFCKTN